MQVYLTIILSLSIVRFLNNLREIENGYYFIGTIIAIATDIVGIVFVWKL